MTELTPEEKSLREEFGIPLDAVFVYKNGPIEEYEWFDPQEGVPPWNKGMPWDEEIKKKISETNKRKGIKPPPHAYIYDEERLKRHSEGLKGNQRRKIYQEGDVCKVDGCNEPPFASWKCRKHKNEERPKRWIGEYRYQGLIGNKNAKRYADTCSVDECDGDHYSKGMCKSHYNKDYKQKRKLALR